MKLSKLGILKISIFFLIKFLDRKNSYVAGRILKLKGHSFPFDIHGSKRGIRHKKA